MGLGRWVGMGLESMCRCRRMLVCKIEDEFMCFCFEVVCVGSVQAAAVGMSTAASGYLGIWASKYTCTTSFIYILEAKQYDAIALKQF